MPMFKGFSGSPTAAPFGQRADFRHVEVVGLVPDGRDEDPSRARGPGPHGGHHRGPVVQFVLREGGGGKDIDVRVGEHPVLLGVHGEVVEPRDDGMVGALGQQVHRVVVETWRVRHELATRQQVVTVIVEAVDDAAVPAGGPVLRSRVMVPMVQHCTLMPVSSTADDECSPVVAGQGDARSQSAPHGRVRRSGSGEVAQQAGAKQLTLLGPS